MDNLAHMIFGKSIKVYKRPTLQKPGTLKCTFEVTRILNVNENMHIGDRHLSTSHQAVTLIISIAVGRVNFDSCSTTSQEITRLSRLIRRAFKFGQTAQSEYTSSRKKTIPSTSTSLSIRSTWHDLHVMARELFEVQNDEHLDRRRGNAKAVET